jgi:hypothetical protein
MPNVTLPNGQTVSGVPEGTTQAVLIDKLVTNGTITRQEAQEWGFGVPEGTLEPVEPSPADTLALQQPSPLPISDALERLPGSLTEGPVGSRPETFAGVGDAVASNMDLPSGIAGSIAGAKLGVPAGAAGMIGGGILGGVAGTFGGSLVSDYLTGDEMDIPKATRNALLSGGMDIVTLGALSKFKSAAKAMGFGPEELASLWNKHTKGFAGKAEPLPVHSPESLRQTQSFLESGEGSLTAYQTGQASGATEVMEGLANVGVISGSYYDTLATKNANTIAEGVEKLINDATHSLHGDDIGQSIYGVVQGGKKAAQKMYEEGLEEINQRVGRAQVEPKWLYGVLRKFKKEGQKEWGSTYDPATLKLVNEWEGALRDLPSMSVDSLLAFQKKLNTQVNSLAEFGATQNTVASRELAELSNRVRRTTSALLKHKSPESHKVYENLNKAYGEAMDGVVPKLNAGTIQQADKGDFESIARVLEGKNPDKIEAFMKSIDEAYTQARIAGVDMAETARFATPEAAKQAVRAGWLKNIFGESVSEGFDPQTFSKLAKHYEKPANIRSAKAILGKDWPTFKKLTNAMAESTKKPNGMIGTLVLRSKEAGVASQIAQLATGAGILFGPVMLSKMASSPAAVRRLLAGEKAASAAVAAGKASSVSKILYETAQDIMEGFDEEDQAEIRNSIR